MEWLGLFEAAEPGELSFSVVTDFKGKSLNHFFSSDFFLEKKGDVLVLEAKAF